MAETTFQVQGMTCDHCVHAVSEELGHIPGVRAVQIDLATGAVTVESDGDIDPSAVHDAIGEAGYELASP